MNPRRFWGQPARYNMRDHENGYQSSFYQQYPCYHPPPFHNIPSYSVQLHVSARRPNIFRTEPVHECYGCLNCRSRGVQSNEQSFQEIPRESLFPTDYSWDNDPEVLARSGPLQPTRLNNSPPDAPPAESPGLFPDVRDDNEGNWGDFTENESYEELLSLDEGLENPCGLDKQNIESLVTFAFNVDSNQGNQTSCVVCMFDFKRSQLIRMLPCSHAFHAKCIDEWFQTKKTCPICRINISDCTTTSD